MMFILGMHNHENWIGLKKDEGTGRWTWQESQLEANFTLWLNDLHYPCVTMNAEQNGWYIRPCNQRVHNRKAICQI